jgi:hypothetical protein
MKIQKLPLNPQARKCGSLLATGILSHDDNLEEKALKEPKKPLKQLKGLLEQKKENMEYNCLQNKRNKSNKLYPKHLTGNDSKKSPPCNAQGGI